MCAVPFHLPTVCTNKRSSLPLGTYSAVPLISSLPLDTVSVMFSTPLPILTNNSNYQFYSCWQCNITLRIAGFLDFLHYLVFIIEYKISVKGSVHVFSWKASTQLPGLSKLFLRHKSTGASPSFHLTTKNKSSSQSTALSPDNKRSVAIMCISRNIRR